MPYALLEAMASKLPIICSSIPNHLEVIKNNQSAFTINPYEMDELYKRIEVLYENPDIRKKLSENAFDDVKRFNEKDVVKKIEKIYLEVIQD